MSANILSVIPTDPRWQPEPEQADRARQLLAAIAPADPGRLDWELRVEWHTTITVVDSGECLESITCPVCTAAIDIEWWGDLLEKHYDEGFEDLMTTVPCCGARTSLDELHYDWPCGFARFELALWNPGLGRDLLTNQELSAIAQALGHPVRQIYAHI